MVPAAYFITVSAYGHRLHGDELGSVDSNHNSYGSNFIQPNPAWRESARSRMKAPPMRFDAQKREVIEGAFAGVCQFREWELHGAHCRTNHAHIVVTSSADVSRVAHDLKAYATRALREAGLVEPAHTVWAAGASTRYLWKAENVVAALAYTLHGQGEDLPGTAVWRERQGGYGQPTGVHEPSPG